MPSRKHMHFSFSWLKLTYYGIYEWRGKSSCLSNWIIGSYFRNQLESFVFFFF